MKTQQAFEILGIAPTSDRAAIRAAYRRLAKIYHPDRFSTSSDDVRIEAEQRMKLVLDAYAVLRRAELTADAPVLDPEALRLARETREAIEHLKGEESKRAARHRRWQRIEADALERARRAAVAAQQLAFEEASRSAPEPEDRPATAQGPRRSLFAERLEQARMNGNEIARRDGPEASGAAL